MVKNNIINIVETILESLSLRAECLRLEIHIIWEGDTILKTNKNITKLIEVNGQKLEYYNELLCQMGTVNEEINRDLDHITCTSFKMKNSIFHQIQRHDAVAKVVEEKFRQLYELDNKILATEELLLNRLGSYKLVRRGLCPSRLSIFCALISSHFFFTFKLSYNLNAGRS